ncbi:iron-sulfur cluster assembly scaffold protein SufA [Kosakonia sacchari]|uniref:iron-sulfur cluster assembly scaffold protein SufA n=1 Tax=Kosakonia sacchari TaxID=1158459 RepID=UPI002ACE21C1|nr:iron-sulfur cluster assembly scaffold protein SufA [Kosakonia sacchari]MDZ7322936.1 iron-sulfur cluster assembly scaffold protein SufA [Kosakonia sacchari]
MKKKKPTPAALAAIVASLMASLAPVPAKSTMLPASAVEYKTQHGISPALTFELSSGQIYLPLSEATDYLNQVNARQRFLLQAMIQDRQREGKGSLFTDVKGVKKICLESLEQHMRVKEAVLLVLQPDNLAKKHPHDLEERARYKAELQRFGRSLAQGEFILRDLISAIEQSKAPEKTASFTNMPSDADVKAMITAEHKNLGLSAPEFS